MGNVIILHEIVYTIMQLLLKKKGFYPTSTETDFKLDGWSELLESTNH